VFVIILQEDKVKKGKKIGLPVKKRHNFLMKRIIRICRHTFVSDRSDSVLSEFQPIWSRGCQPGTQNAHEEASHKRG